MREKALLCWVLVIGSLSASSLDVLAGVVGGVATTGVPGPCSTYGAPSTLSFFGSASAFSVPQGGIAACGYSGSVAELAAAAAGSLTESNSMAAVLLGNPGFAGIFNGDSSATASYGSLGASARGVITLPGEGAPTALDEAAGAAFFDDVLSISSPLISNLSSGFVRYQFAVQGSLSTPGPIVPFVPGHAGAILSIQSQGGPILRLVQVNSDKGGTGTISVLDGSTAGWTAGTGSISGSGVYGTTNHGLFMDFDLPMQFGVPMELKVGLDAFVVGGGDNFQSTATLLGIQAFDANHNPVNNLIITSDSGTAYLGAPEAGTSVLLCGGLALLLGFRRVRLPAGGRGSRPA